MTSSAAPEPAPTVREAHERAPYTGVHALVRRLIEPVQDALVVLLIVALFGAMVRTLLELRTTLFASALEFRIVISEALFMLVIVELQRLLILYLRDHHVSVDVMVEATITGVLREVFLLGAMQIDAVKVLSLTAFLLGLGALLRFGDLRATRRRIHASGQSQRR